MARVNLVSKDNDSGLSVDLKVMTEALKRLGHDVVWADFRDAGMRECDAAIFLETPSEALLSFARRTVFVPNPDCLDDDEIKLIDRFDHVWAKSQTMHRIAAELPVRHLVLTGFATPDRSRPKKRRKHTVLHMAGRSTAKNTAAVVEAWHRHGAELPPLAITADWDLSFLGLTLPQNAEHLGHVDRGEVANLLNTYAIHLLPSRAEGWGHGIVEGLLCGAQVVTTDADPMNAHVRPEFGWLLPAADEEMSGRVRCKRVDPEDVAVAVKEAAALPAKDRAARGRLGRAHALARNEAFHAAVRDAMGELLS
ncbi:glycosyltransferase [Streptomyces violaceusniger]|uniref:Glycosyl transferase group 1 n=1 Tax=Streptomyces violaceusniger (strain Tu 4113) TaxID=653045 RepID=G2PHJ0_STRV4|nr:glycosyltransferase [Streptomyces violaceusniger]AEM88993.1 glycosyl transferase group 1 [Streptomyces violaceusniger Tu 4113]